MRARGNFRVGQHFRAKEVARIVEHDSRLHHASGRIELLAEVRDLSGEALAGNARQRHIGGLTDPQLSEMFRTH